MTPIETLRAATVATQRVIDVGPIGDEQLGSGTPCREYDVGQLVDHILETHELLLGAAGGDPVELTGAVGDRHQAVAEAAVSRWAARGTEGTVDLGGNELPASFGLALHVLEAYVHGWDLAQGLGRTFDPSSDLTSAVAEIAGQVISDDMRGGELTGPYGRVVALPEGQDAVAELIAFTGRDPRAPIAV